MEMWFILIVVVEHDCMHLLNLQNCMLKRVNCIVFRLYLNKPNLKKKKSQIHSYISDPYMELTSGNVET